MITSWMAYAAVVAGLVSVAAWLAEQGARGQHWSTRWIWASALVVSVAAPLLAWLLPGTPAVATPLVGTPGAYVLESLPALSIDPASATGPSTGTMILVAWLASSTLLLLAVVALATRLGLRLRGWPRRMVDGVEVRVSRDTGPAAMGVLRGRVVVPEWALALEPTQRRLLVLHEAEHVRARDPQLALAGLIVCVLAPWNLPLWWQLRRLRLAIEVDCDGRVMRRSPHLREYGSLLVTVGRRKAHLALALAESRSMLERRIRMITGRSRARAPFRAAALAGVSTLVLAVACETPTPTGPTAASPSALDLGTTQSEMEAMGCEPDVYVNGEVARLEGVDPDNVEAIHVFKGPAANALREDGEVCGVVVVLTKDATPKAADAGRRLVERLNSERLRRAGAEDRRRGLTAEQIRQEPTFTPMTVAPRLVNPGEVKEALQRLYPPLLRDAGIGGTVNVWFLIDREGAVQRTVINEPAEHAALNQAAMAVAERMEFTPAYNREERVPVWIALDIAFEVAPGDAASAEAPERPLRVPSERAPAAREGPGHAAPPGRDGDLVEKPTFTPMTVAPRLRNAQEMQRLLQRHYPPLLRDAGIDGTTSVWFFVDDTGRVVKVQVHRSSGYDALDEAALAAARQLEFEPARNRDQPVPVWVALDITFEVQ